MQQRTIKVAASNFENNGGGDSSKRSRMAALVSSLNLDLLLGQEKWDAAANGNQLTHWADTELGLRTFLGARSCTAVSVNPERFRVEREWPDSAPVWMLPPTALTLRFTAAGPEAVPLVVASFHLNYCMPDLRSTEAQAVTSYADRSYVTSSGHRVRLPLIGGGDTNSYPAPGVPGDPELPVLEHIADLPHRAHRSYMGPDGRRVMDTRPDEVLRTAGLEDVARHMATRPENPQPSAVARTVEACSTHGPDARIDRIYASAHLLPAITAVEVIDVPRDLSDHHIVMATMDADVLRDRLRESAVEQALEADVAAAAAVRAAA